MDKETISDCIDYFQEKGIPCRNITRDIVEVLIKTPSMGKDCWVQISEEEIIYRAVKKIIQ
jgi:hypothetical protein